MASERRLDGTGESSATQPVGEATSKNVRRFTRSCADRADSCGPFAHATVLVISPPARCSPAPSRPGHAMVRGCELPALP